MIIYNQWNSRDFISLVKTYLNLYEGDFTQMETTRIQDIFRTASKLFGVLGISIYAVMARNPGNKNRFELRTGWIGEENSRSQAPLFAPILADKILHTPATIVKLTTPEAAGVYANYCMAVCAGLDRNNSLVSRLLLATLHENQLGFHRMQMHVNGQELFRINNQLNNSFLIENHADDVISISTERNLRPIYKSGKATQIDLVSDKPIDFQALAEEAEKEYKDLSKENLSPSSPYGVIFTKFKGKEVAITFSLR